MVSLEAKIPPPIVGLVVAAAMWGTYRFAPLLQLPSALRLGVALAILVAGLSFSVAGMLAFRRAQTTVNPTTPEKATALVTSGVYRITRNPMYVGVSLDLLSLAVFLSSAWALLGPVAFTLYIGRLQIAPEERALEKVFGNEYANYRARVRRWL
jgi:protein-S-isoprenylcysteine O-methyltransferase Ste14